MEMRQSTLDGPDKLDEDTPAATSELLPLRKHLNLLQTLDLLSNPVTVKESIPSGLKEDVYFLIDNSRNMSRRKNGQYSDFTDDCGAWISKAGASPKTVYHVNGNNFKKLFLLKGLYCCEKKANKKREYVPLEPQPSPENLLCIQRYYATLKADDSYKKSYLDQPSSESLVRGSKYCHSRIHRKISWTPTTWIDKKISKFVHQNPRNNNG